MEKQDTECPKCKSKEVTKRGFRITDNSCPCCKQECMHPVFYRDVNDKFSCIRIPDTWFCTYCGYIKDKEIKK